MCIISPLFDLRIKRFTAWYIPFAILTVRKCLPLTHCFVILKILCSFGFFNGFAWSMNSIILNNRMLLIRVTCLYSLSIQPLSLFIYLLFIYLPFIYRGWCNMEKSSGQIKDLWAHVEEFRVWAPKWRLLLKLYR